MVGAPLRAIKVYKERRLGEGAERWRERRTYCWTIQNCDPATRAQCHAHIVKENCWDFWVVKGAKYKACCQKIDDCRQCSVAQQKFVDRLPVYVRVPGTRSPTPLSAPANCAHLHLLRGKLPNGQALRQFLREQEEQDRDLFRCRQRGVHLDPTYVGDVCASRNARECVFL